MEALVHDPLSLLLPVAPRRARTQYLMNDHDREMFALGAQVQPLRSVLQGAGGRPTWPNFEPYYEELIAEYFPRKAALVAPMTAGRSPNLPRGATGC